jgi:hypothetical protein
MRRYLNLLRPSFAVVAAGSVLLLAKPAQALDLYTNNSGSPNPGSGCSSLGIAADYWVAYRFTPTTSGTATNVAIWTEVCCGFNANGIIELRNDNGGVPGTVLGSGTFTAPGTAAQVSVSIGNVNVSAGTTYWVVVRPNGSGTPAMSWDFQSSTAAGSSVKRSSNSGASWADYYVSACGATKTPSLEVIGTVTNVAPTVSAFTSSGYEDTSLAFGAMDFTNHYADGNGDGMARIEIESLPAHGALWNSSTQISTVPYQIVTANIANLHFEPTADWNGSTSFTWKAQDGVLWSVAAATATINMAAVNDAPKFTPGASPVVVNEDSGAFNQLWATGISAGPPDEASQSLTFTFTTNNSALFSAGPAINSSTGALSFTPAANANGFAFVSMLRLQDNGGTANGGVDQTTTSGQTIMVNPVNDAPSFSLAGDVTVAEDCGSWTVAKQAFNIVAGPADESGQAVTFSAVPSVPGLFATAPSIDSSGTLTFKPALNASGDSVVTVLAHDNGGTTYGGVDTSSAGTFTIHVTSVNHAPSFTPGSDQVVLEDAAPQSVAWATNISAGPANEANQTLTFHVSCSNLPMFSAPPTISAAGVLAYTLAANANGSSACSVYLKDSGGGSDSSATVTLNITATPVNDPPSFTLGSDISVPEDSPAQTWTNFVSAVSPGPTDESSQTVTFGASATNSSLFSVQPVFVGTTLTFTPAANANGTSVVTVTGTDNGGIDNGGVNTTVRTFQVTLTPVNDAPVIDSAQSPVLTAINEGDTNSSGTRVADMITSVQPAVLITDVDTGALRGIAITVTDETNGTWQYSLNGGTDWTSVGAVSDSSALLLDDNTGTFLRFVPQAGFSGDSTVTFRAWDRTSGAVGGKADTSTNGGTTAFSVHTAVGKLTVKPFGISDAGVDCDADGGNVDVDAELDADLDTSADGELDATADANVDAELDATADANVDAELDADAKADAVADADAADSGSDADGGSVKQDAGDAGSDVKTDTGVKTDSGTSAKDGGDAGSGDSVADSSDGSGCGCQQVGSATNTGWLLSGLLGCIAVLRRRKQSSKQGRQPKP